MEETLLGGIRVVLVQTSHPGNIGAVARAMKTMSLSHLCLVEPKRFPCAEATARAAGADDILYHARVFDTFEEALAGCHWVAGTSARARHIGWPELSPREFAGRALAQVANGDVALVFGREQWGLTNAELDRCQALVRIPANPLFNSLNLASAVQVLAYELQAAWDAALPMTDSAGGGEIVGAQDLEGLYGHLEQALEDIGYYDPEKPKKLMRRLRRLFHRIELERSELNILRGILSAAQHKAKRSG